MGGKAMYTVTGNRIPPEPQGFQLTDQRRTRQTIHNNSLGLFFVPAPFSFIPYYIYLIYICFHHDHLPMIVFKMTMTNSTDVQYNCIDLLNC